MTFHIENHGFEIKDIPAPKRDAWIDRSAIAALYHKGEHVCSLASRQACADTAREWIKLGKGR